MDKKKNYDQMKMWVFRNKGNGGNPTRACPIGAAGLVDPDKLRQSVIKTTPLDYDKLQQVEKHWFTCNDFLDDELINHNRLRQGWGFPGLNLKLPGKDWIENWIKGCWQYWLNQKEDCDSAAGQLSLLQRIEDMDICDIIFIPHVPSDKWYTVARVERKYYFEDRTHYPDTWLKDYGHVIGVSHIKSWSRDVSPLRKYKGLFKPYQCRINQIESHHQFFNAFSDFVNDYYLKRKANGVQN